MIKVAIISDLHLEFSDILPHQLEIPDDVDCIILAGDLHPNREMQLYYLSELNQIAPTLYVPGNHDYYRGYTTAYDDVVEATIKDVKIAGATLWTDLTKQDDWNAYAMFLNDCRFMGKDVWTQKTYTDLHSEHLKFLRKSNADIIFTHHSPTYQSVAPRFKKSSLNFCFATDLENEIAIMKPRIWIHGHMHNKSDYMIGSTRIIAHPRGYPQEENHYNYKAKVITI